MIFLERKNYESLFTEHHHIMSSKIIKIIDEVSSKDRIKIDNKSVKIRDKDKKLLENIKTNIESYIIGDLDTQESLIKEMKKYNCVYKGKVTKYKKDLNAYKILCYVFIQRGYESFSTGFKTGFNIARSKFKDGYSAYRFIQDMGIRTCPYCNRNFISLREKIIDTHKQTRPELDHFHPKSIYPFLAVNFYNLIPSCSTCNKLKSDDDSFNLMHPYNQETKKIKFSYTYNGEKFYPESMSLKDEELVSIQITNITKEHNYTFQLERLYQEHKDIIVQLLIQRREYSEDYIDFLAKFADSKEEIYRFLFSNYYQIDCLSKKPLAKLTRDIVEELKFKLIL